MLYDLPENCQYQIYKTVFSNDCLRELKTFDYKPITGPLHERAYYRISYAPHTSFDERFRIAMDKVSTEFYNHTTSDIRVYNYIWDGTEEHSHEPLFPDCCHIKTLCFVD